MNSIPWGSLSALLIHSCTPFVEGTNILMVTEEGIADVIGSWLEAYVRGYKPDKYYQEVKEYLKMYRENMEGDI